MDHDREEGDALNQRVPPNTAKEEPDAPKQEEPETLKEDNDVLQDDKALNHEDALKGQRVWKRKNQKVQHDQEEEGGQKKRTRRSLPTQPTNSRQEPKEREVGPPKREPSTRKWRNPKKSHWEKTRDPKEEEAEALKVKGLSVL